MALLNYSTKIRVEDTLSEIQQRLARHGARQVLLVYGEYGDVEAISFAINTPFGMRGFRLPADVDKTLAVLERQYDRGQLRKGGRPTRDQAARVAWRIIKDWLEAQLALIETEMVTLDQIMLPYLQVDSAGRTLYEAMVEQRLALPPPQERNA